MPACVAVTIIVFQGLTFTGVLAYRYAWWSPDAKVEAEITGPNALYYGEGNATALTSLGKVYLEQLYPTGLLAS